MPVEVEPEVARVPLQLPLAVHAVALVELHVKVLALPLVTDVGLAVNDTVGAGVVQLSPGWPLVKVLLGTQVLSDRSNNTLSTLTPALRPRIFAV